MADLGRGGAQPHWRRDGRELYYRTSDGVMSVSVEAAGAGFRAGKPQTLFKATYLGGLGGIVLPGFNFPDFEAAPSGQSFVMFEGKTEKREAARAKVVIGWFQELERLTTSGGR